MEYELLHSRNTTLMTGEDMYRTLENCWIKHCNQPSCNKTIPFFNFSKQVKTYSLHFVQFLLWPRPEDGLKELKKVEANVNATRLRKLPKLFEWGWRVE